MIAHSLSVMPIRAAIRLIGALLSHVAAVFWKRKPRCLATISNGSRRA